MDKIRRFEDLEISKEPENYVERYTQLRKLNHLDTIYALYSKSGLQLGL